ncbi:MAG TPA: large conductance mechanosensitive channel protein MscL [Ktedonobacterales bacterium]|jgi:large conductance mechanosensitive channel
MRWLDEFRAFILRGNVIDLAVAVVIGAAFTAVVTSLVANLITPLIAAIFGKPDFSDLSFTINGSIFRYGAFFNAVISFFLIALVVFFLIVKPMNALMARMGRGAEAETPSRECPYCISSIPVTATKCAYCTSEVEPVPPPPDAPVSAPAS